MKPEWGIICLLLIFANPFKATGQGVPEIIAFDNHKYNGSHQNWMFAQDCNDLLYVANTDGVLIYNGYSWRKVEILDGKRPRCIYAGEDCKVYVGGFEFFGYISIKNPASPKFIPLDVNGLSGSREEIWNIFGKKGLIVFQSFADVYTYDFKRFTKLKPTANIMLGARVGKELFIPKIENGIYLLENGGLTELDWFKNVNQPIKITALVESGEGVLITTQHDGVYIKSKGAELRKIKIETSPALESQEINKAIRLREGGYAIGTISNGVYLLDEELRVRHILNKQNSLSNNTVLALFQDKEGDLWVGLDKGINQVKLDENHLMYYDKTGSIGTLFSAVEGDQGELIIGTNQGLFVQNEEREFSLVSGIQGQVWSLLQQNKDLLVGHNNGTLLWREGKLSKVSEQAGGWDMSVLPDGSILQSTYNGFIRLTPSQQGWTSNSRIRGQYLPMERFALSGNEIMGYHIDYGLLHARFTSNFDSIYAVEKIADPKDLPLDNQVIIFTDQDRFMILNQGKFYKLEDKVLHPIDANDRYENRYYNNVRLSITDNYAPHNAFKNLAEKGWVIKVIDDGFEIWKNKYEPPLNCDLSLDYFTVNGALMKTSAKQNQFEPEENNLVIFLRKPFEKCGQMMYQLAGWDKEWEIIPENGQISYRNLRKGEYNLLVKNQLNGQENTVLSFEIEPHWYESWPGLLLLISIIFVAFYLFNLWHKRNLQNETARLNKEKEQLLERQRILASNEKMAHDLSYKSKMLANSTMTLVQKNNMLNDLKELLAHEDASDTGRKKWKQKMKHLIEQNLSSDTEWEIFEQNFAEVHEDFLDRLKELHPHLTSGEQRLAAYIRMDLSSKEIAPLMNISLRSVENKRYRLRKRLGLEHDDNLSAYLTNL